jgi:hypothetical protein
MTLEPVVLALRAAPVGDPAQSRPPAHSKTDARSPWRWQRAVLVITVEAEPRGRQELVAARCRLFRRGLCVAEHIVVPDGLPAGSRAVAEHYAARVKGSVRFQGGGIAVGDMTSFAAGPLDRYLLGQRAMLVAFDLPFVASRVARNWGPSREGDGNGGWVLDGGFSLSFWGSSSDDRSWDDGPGHPRLRLRQVADQVCLMSWGGLMKGKSEKRRNGPRMGHLLDLRHLARTFGGPSDRDFESACRSHGVPISPSRGQPGVLSAELLDTLSDRLDAMALLLDACLGECDAWEEGT